MKSANAVPDVENNWTFCEFGDMSDGIHTVGLIAKTKERRFWFDYIEYQPTGTIDKEAVRVTRNDTDLLYGGSWSPLADGAQHTTVKGSNVSFNFIGKSQHVSTERSVSLTRTQARESPCMGCIPISCLMKMDRALTRLTEGPLPHLQSAVVATCRHTTAESSKSTVL